jgi:tetratricopeptide (TPR) repeat protein
MNADELAERLSAAWRMPYGRGQIAAVEDVIRHADAQNLADLQFAARMFATHAYTFGGEPAKAFVTFSWCLAAYDRGDTTGADHDLFWQFKWVTSALTKFPEVPLERAHAALDDMERRYRLAGHTLNPVYQYRWVVAQHVGDVELAEEQYRLWCAAPRGEMSDCIGCEPTSKVRHLAWRGRHEDAVALALPVLGGTLTCVEQPQAILTELLVPYLRTGRLEEAAAAHREAYRALQANRGELGLVADHVAFCAYTGNEARGLELVERHLGWLEDPPTPLADMYFSASAALVLDRVAGSGHADLALRNGTVVSALRDELTERALGLAARFDERNGTSEQGDAIRALLAAEPLVDHLPLSGPARRGPTRQVAPPAVEYPSDPQELAELALRESRLYNRDAADAAWQRFDEAVPEPSGALLARRLDFRAAEAANSDPAAAEDLWLRAADLFASASDDAGRHSVLSRLGMLWIMTGRTEEGLAQVQASVAALAAAGKPDEHARGLGRLSTAYQLSGRFDEALAALEEARALDIPEQLTAEILLDLADVTTATSLERLPDALAHARAALGIYESIGECGGLRLAQVRTARLHAASGDLETAFDLFGQAALADSAEIRGSALHDRGRVGLDLDRADEAYQALTGAVADLLAAGWTDRAAYARVDLTAAALSVGQHGDAADAAEDAASELDALGDADEAARARFLLARAYRELGQLEPALDLLDSVAAHCAENSNLAGVGQMNAMAGEILDRLDQDEDAAARFLTAADAYRTAEIPLAELENRRRAAMSWRWVGATDRSLTCLSAADTAAAALSPDDPPTAWQLAMLHYDGARILAAADRPGDALHRAKAAAATFRSLDATTEAAMADALHGRLLVDLDRPAEAEKLLVAALDALPEDATLQREDLEDLLAEIRG